jgi:hypothetical protein
MSQGKAWDRDEVIDILEPFFKMGMNVTKACKYAGVPRTTVQTWIEDDELLRLKVESWQALPSHKARANWIAKIEEGDFVASEKWLSKTEKDEFSDKTTVEHEGKIELLPITGMKIIKDGGTSE